MSEERTAFPGSLAGSPGLGALVGKLADVVEKAIDEPLSYVINWGRLYSLWPVHVETACCSAEFGATHGSRFDIERFGILEAFGSLRQCDLLIIFGTVTRKMMPRLKIIYDQMPEPKYVIAMGACAINGGLYFDSYNVLPGVDKIIPVDVFIPGCPPRPETLIQGIVMLQEKIRRMKALDIASKIRSLSHRLSLPTAPPATSS